MTDKEKYLMEVGDVAVGWAALEFQMDFLIWKLAEVEQMVGACITSQIPGVTAKIRSIIALLRLRQAPDELIKKFSSFDGQCTEAREDRNRVVHSPLGIFISSGTHTRFESKIHKKRLSFGFQPNDILDLQNLFQKITEHNDAFSTLDKETTDWLKASDQKWRGQLLQIVKDPPHALSQNSDQEAPQPQPPPSPA